MPDIDRKRQTLQILGSVQHRYDRDQNAHRAIIPRYDLRTLVAKQTFDWESFSGVYGLLGYGVR